MLILPKHQCLTHEMKDNILELIHSEHLGEPESVLLDDGFVLERSIPVQSISDLHMLFLGSGKDNFDKIKSAPFEDSYKDTATKKYRYAYVKDPAKNPKSNKSRDFCKVMLSKDLIFRREDISFMSFQGVNGKLAQKGRNNYSIFKYIGGNNCVHMWELRVYVKDKKDKWADMMNGAPL